MTRKYKTVIIIVLFIMVAAGIITAVSIVANKYLNGKDKKAVACGTTQTTGHIVVIKDGKDDPVNTTAPLCDTLTILNMDNITRLMTFGPHDEHKAYDGVEEKAISQGESLTVTLNKAGSFQFHDHVDDLAKGTFTVTDPAK